jgi:hypothetical protein
MYYMSAVIGATAPARACSAPLLIGLPVTPTSTSAAASQNDFLSTVFLIFGIRAERGSQFSKKGLMMQITFVHQGTSLEIHADNPSEVKLYAVPPAYSNDGYFVAIWAFGDVEPYPACAAEKVTLLAHAKIAMKENGTAEIQSIFCKQGVTYAAP